MMTEKKRKKFQKVKPGDILKIPIDGDTHTYGQVLPRKTVLVYDYRTQTDITDFSVLTADKELFRAGVYYNVLSSMVWPKVGFLALSPEEANPSLILEYKARTVRSKHANVAMYMDQFELYFVKMREGEVESSGVIASSFEECKGLERVIVCDDLHIQERLLYYYEGADNWIKRKGELSDLPWAPPFWKRFKNMPELSAAQWEQNLQDPLSLENIMLRMHAEQRSNIRLATLDLPLGKRTWHPINTLPENYEQTRSYDLGYGYSTPIGSTCDITKYYIPMPKLYT